MKTIKIEGEITVPDAEMGDNKLTEDRVLELIKQHIIDDATSIVELWDGMLSLHFSEPEEVKDEDA